MKAVYDKLLFVLALLILAGSVGYFFFVASSETAEESGVLALRPSGGAYSAIAAPQFERSEAQWPAPDPQDEDGNWLFDVFTPPRIYWDLETGKFVSEPWQPREEAPPFALELVNIEQELFRIQMEAYFTGAQPEDAILQFVNTQKETSFRGTVGTVFEDHQIRVDGFEIERQFNDDGSVVMVGSATVTDLTNNEQFVLNTAKKLYIEGSFTITMKTTAPLPVETFIWKAVGDKQQIGDTTFELNAFNIDEQTATVTKSSPKMEEAEQAVLNAVSAPAEKQSSAPEIPVDNTGDSSPSSLPAGLENIFR